MGKNRTEVFVEGTTLRLKRDMPTKKMKTIHGRLGLGSEVSHEAMLDMTFRVIATPTDGRGQPLPGDGIWIMSKGEKVSGTCLCSRMLEQLPTKTQVTNQTELASDKERLAA